MLSGDLSAGMWGEIAACILSSRLVKGGEQYRGQICLGEEGRGSIKHSCNVAVGTVKAVFHNRVHMLTALLLWCCTLTAALNNARSHRLLPLAI